MNNKKVEIMAPAGSFESLQAAINAGCDSIYFGVEQLNMRARSSMSFSTDDLVRIAELCTANEVKSYITINTILYDHDIMLMKQIVDKAKESGISAIIASDHSVMNYAKKVGMPIHISTQANVSNIDTVEFYSMFADVVVLSRELSLTQVAKICSEIERRNITGPSGKLVRVEVFVHGALCMAVSGKCYLSLHSHNASANRGACIQNCRKQYVVTDMDEGTELLIDNEYIMSAKDLCVLPFLDKVIDAGVSILKIEGRGRSADYVHTTVTTYRDALNALDAGTWSDEKVNQWMEELSKVFNRGFWDGYYLGRKMGEWNDSYGSKATEKKIFIGRGVKYFNKIKVGEFKLETFTLKRGDEVMITGPTTGYLRKTIDELRVDGKEVDEVKKGESFSIAIDNVIRASDKLYKVVPNN